MVFVLDDANSNVLIGTAEIDELFGLGGADSISGGEGFDLLFGNQDNDTIWGEVGDDIVYAGRDNDLIFGGLGNDRIFGDVGNDTIHGDKGTDILTGGIGSDIFLLQEIAASFDETDIVSDFKVGEDLIQIASDLDLEAVIADSIDSGNSTLLRHPDTKEFLLILQNVSPESLTSGNFDPALEIIIPSLEPPVIIVPEIDDQPPTIEASLVNDTGLENNDGITSDPTITGRATDNRGMPWVEVNFGDGFVSVGAEIEEDGSFRIEQAQLEQAFGGSLADGDYNLLFRSVDLSRLVSPNFASVDFTLDTTAPEISAELANNTGEADGITTDPKVVGTVTEANITALRAGSGGNLQDVSNLLDASGDFEFGQLQLEAFLGTSLTEGTEYTLELEAEDALGQVAATELSFTLATSEPDTPTPPEEIEEIIDGDEEPLIVERVERNITEEPGNTLENASRIAVTSNTSVYSGEVSGDGLEDFYTFTLGATTNLSLDLTGSRNDTDLLEADADLLLLDSNGDEIDSSETIGINSESITRPLEAGTYFIQVESFDGIPTDYKLAVSANSRLPGITTTGAEGEGEFDVVESNVLINLEAPETDPSVVAFRNSFSDIDGSGFSVVVLDSGLDLDHPFFGGNGDGEISDRIVFQFDYGEYDADASDFNGHGSNVTSIIASEDDTYTGIAPGANIIHLKVGTDEGGPSRAAVEQALQWVTQNVEEYNIASVNMSLSLGGSSQEPVTPREIGISDELAELAAKNVIVVSSSGNDYPVPGVKYPSSDPNSLSVGAVWDGDNGGPFGDGISGPTDFTTGADRIVSFSQRDPNLTDIFAPGAFITGANQNGETVTLEGTSQAAPHITGVAVLAQQLAMETIGRRLDLGEFRTLLQNTGVTIFDGDENGNGVVDGDEEDDNVFNTQTEYKRVDVLALGEAILALDSTSEPPDQPELVRYDFAYYYDLDSLRTEDVYQGYTYAEAGLFDLGELGILYDPFSGDSEVGTNGQYYIFDDSGEVPETALSGEVYVDRYFDVDASGEVYTPFYFANGLASGLGGLGSEYDFISTGNGTFDNFGLDYVEADGLDQIFSNSRFERADYPANLQPGRTVNADLNNDGRDELIVADTSERGSGFSLLFNQGDGSFDLPIDITTATSSSGAGDDPSLDVGDIDGDGNIDLITVNPETDEVSIYFNDGDGNLSLPSTFEAGDRPVISETADIDSDDSTDVVLINSEFDEFGVGYQGDSLSVLFNRPDDNVFTLTAGEGVEDVVAADLDGDGDVDLATANQVDDTVSVLFNLGNILFTSPITFPVGDRPVSIVADDFDGNGSIDLATSDFGDEGTGTVSVLRNIGNGFFAPALTYETNDFPSTMSAADLDGDGDSDLVMRNSVFFESGDRRGNSIAVLLNNGDATFDAPISFTVGDVPVGLIVEDLDGNRRCCMNMWKLEYFYSKYCMIYSSTR